MIMIVFYFYSNNSFYRKTLIITRDVCTLHFPNAHLHVKKKKNLKHSRKSTKKLFDILFDIFYYNIL